MFFTLSKIFWYVATPSTLLMLLLCFKRHNKKLIALVLMLLVLPIGDYLTYGWEHRIAAQNPEKVDGIIILGGVINPVMSRQENQIAMNSAAERVTAVIPLVKKHPRAKVIFASGSGDLQHPEALEAPFAKRAFKEWGVEAGRITFEDKSRNTYENALFAKEIARPQKDEKWLLVTSAIHMSRAKAVFDRLGWRVIPYPVDYRAEARPKIFSFTFLDNMAKIDAWAHEIIGLIVYRWTGKA